MTKKRNNIKSKIILIIVLLVIVIVLGVFFYYKKVYLPRIVMDYRTSWDVFLSQNTKMSGTYMGKIYEKDYQITDLTIDVISTLIADYYINNTDGFFSEENRKDDNTYQKSISSQEMSELIKKIFGPDYYNISVTDIKYGYGRYLKMENGYYVIGSKDPDACGIFSGNFATYISKIDGYHKENGNIIVDLKVGYVEAKKYSNSEGENMMYLSYIDKTKTKLLNSNYSEQCVFGENTDDACYEGFSNYSMTLEKQSDGNYYFQSIKRVS